MLQLLYGLFEKFATLRAKNSTLRALNRGLINIIPFVLVGAVATAIINLPIPALQEVLETLTGGGWYRFGSTLSEAAIGIVGLAALLSVSHALAVDTEAVSKGEISVFVPMFAALSCYTILYVVDVTANGGIAFPRVGGVGILYALLTALVSVKLFFAFARLGKRLRRRSARAFDADLEMRSAFHSIFPLTATLCLVALTHALLGYPMHTNAIAQGIDFFAYTWLTSDNFGSVMLTVLAEQVLWFFGVQGSDTILTRFPSIVDAGQALNGGSVPMFANTEFYYNFVSLGGAGATLGLLVALFLVGSHYRGRRLAKTALFPAIFNINEILAYGLPIVLNPLLVIPFILAPLLIAMLSYFAFSTGIVSPIIQTTEWTTPVFFSGYITTGSLAGSLLQLVSLSISTTLYVPFVILARRLEQSVRVRRFDELRGAAIEAAEDEVATVIARSDDLGTIAREFVSELHDHFDNEQLPFHLVYQPKTDAQGQVYGAEALLRWQHPFYGAISPVMLVEMTDEADLSTPLGRWVTRTAIAQYAAWKLLEVAPPLLSINLNPRHLGEDAEFPAYVGELLKQYGIKDGEIELEITEHMAVRSSEATTEMFRQLRELGVELSIDDMGMGYSSLTYISDYGVHTVKIDTSLVSAITSDEQQQEIVRSIVSLAEQLNLEIIVEGVETQEQLEALVALGCSYFQGYYFSRPLITTDFEDYICEHGVAS